MPFSQFNSGTTWEEAKALRRADVSTIDQLERNKLKGRSRIDRAAPSSSTDVINGDGEGDIVVTSSYIYTLLSVDSVLKWHRVAFGTF